MWRAGCGPWRLRVRSAVVHDTPKRAYAGVAHPGPSTAPPRSRRPVLIGGLLFAAAGLYAYDYANAKVLRRTARTFYHGAVITADFKLNYDKTSQDAMNAVHERVAKRVHHVCITNAGLYIKLAQSLAIQTAILPKPYQVALAGVFDSAAPVPYSEVESTFIGEFGATPTEVFDSFDPVPIASASIAQVHRARLKRKEGQPEWKEGEGWVAVKVRKQAVVEQIEWDLWAYKALLWAFEKSFDIPCVFIADYVTQQMRLEVDLHNEAKNATRTAELLAKEPSLRERAMVPRVYWEHTGKAVMTAEYVKGCKLTDKASLAAQGLDPKKAMDTALNAFSAMIFSFGHVHCDPHPGNILVRQHPTQWKGVPQVIIIDHGLYIDMPEDFRHEYCLLWRSLFVGDINAIATTAVKWGIAKDNASLFASATLLKPHSFSKEGVKRRLSGEKESPEEKKARQTAAQAALKEKMKSFLESQELIPRELIFLARAMRMMQANNQALGSPSNRINILATWASTGLDSFLSTSPRTLKALGVRNFAVEKGQAVIFKVVLAFVDVGFGLSRARQAVLSLFGIAEGEDFESLLEQQTKDLMEGELGIELNDEAFKG